MLSMWWEGHRVRGISLIVVLVMTVVHAFTTLQPTSSNNMTKQNSSSSLSSSSSPSPPLDKNSSSRFRLGYVTDVEGNIEYFLQFVQHSHVLTIQYWDTKTLVLALKDEESYFVYGGDAVDKGPGDIRLVRALVALKRRYPRRVYLLVGNRDLNKLRFVSELSPDELTRPLSEIPPPHWDPTAPSFLEYLTHKQQQQQHNENPEDNPNSNNTTNMDLQTLNTRTNRLQYMLTHTLGCPNTFEFRREELGILRNTNDEDEDKDDEDATNQCSIDDETVVDSFLEELQLGGSLYDYLSLADVAIVIGTTLFCHGAVDRQTMGFVPKLDTKFEIPTSKPGAGRSFLRSTGRSNTGKGTAVVEWTEALNEYLQIGLDDYNQRPHWNANRTSRGGEALLALQNRAAMWGRSIVSNCYGDGGCITTSYAAEVRKERHLDDATDANDDDDDDDNNNHNGVNDPLLFENTSSDPMDTEVAQWLLQNGIYRVVVGHKPTGDSPAVLSADYTGVEIVSADTSFSDTSCADNRGRVVSVVELVGRNEHTNQLHLYGILQTGQAYDSWFPTIRRRRQRQQQQQQQRDITNYCNNDTDDDDNTNPSGDIYLGKQLPRDGWWVKASYYDDSKQEEYYCLARGKGRRVEYQYIPKRELHLKMNHQQHDDAPRTSTTATVR